MSRIELHIGTVKKVDTQGLTIEEWCQRECEKLGVTELTYGNSNYLEVLADITKYNRFLKIKDKLYEITDAEYEDDDIYEMYPNEDGSYSYVMRFYNGGTCLSECLEWGLNEK